MKFCSIAITVLVTSLLGGCASLSSPPPRPAYTGSDTVEQIDPANIVGNWSMRVLNPRENEEMPEQTIQFNADGTAVGRMKNMPGMEELGDLEFETTADWLITEDVVTTSNVEVKEISGNSMGGLMTAIANTQSKKMAGTANIMEATDKRMVWAWDGDDAVMEYTRIE